MTAATPTPTTPPATGDQLARLDAEIVRLVDHCSRLQAWIRWRIPAAPWREAETLRHLNAASLVTARLARMLLKRAAITGPDEIERFFAEVSDRVYELAGADPPPQLP